MQKLWRVTPIWLLTDISLARILIMLSLSHTTGYAIIALGCIGSWKGEWVLSKQIHRCTGVPMPYLRKMLFALGKAGLIHTKRGYQGGFVLARPSEKITLLDVARAVEKTEPAPDCLLGLPGCSEATPCPLRSFWQKERRRIEIRLSRITVAQASNTVRAARSGKLVKCPPCGPPSSRRRPAGAARRKPAAKAKGTRARAARRKRS